MEMNVEYSPRFYPLLEIWFRPRRTIRRLITETPGKYADTLAILYSSSSVLIRYTALAIPLDSEFFVPLLKIKLTIWGFFWALISIRLSGYVTGVIGRRLGGTATNRETRTAVAWSYLPLMVCYLLLWIPQANILDGRGSEAILSSADQFAFSFIIFSRMIASFWTTFLYTTLLAEVHRFAWWRGFITMLLGSGIVYAIQTVVDLLLNQAGIIN